MLKKLKDWYEGEYIPYENEADSSAVIIGGDMKRPLLARVISATIDFFKVHWKWVITTLIAFLAVLAAMPFAIINYQKLTDPEVIHESSKTRLPGFGFIIFNETEQTIRIKTIGSFQLLADLTPMTDTVMANGRFILGSRSGDKPDVEYFEILPGKSLHVDGSFISPNNFNRYYQAGDLEVSFFLEQEGRLIIKGGMLFNQDHLIAEPIAIFVKETHNKPVQPTSAIAPAADG
ncbi:hypothetical protein [uncultured Shewanella sp.]|uniref:hypothetical protein n=1 Tax=uncultured Shewanella sp. TaxID=173975 RepID=UPI00262ABA56|nr:hypothetical protein [uncultured Shewanella sp.]